MSAVLDRIAAGERRPGPADLAIRELFARAAWPMPGNDSDLTTGEER
jgi:hypothetical protein